MDNTDENQSSNVQNFNEDDPQPSTSRYETAQASHFISDDDSDNLDDMEKELNETIKTTISYLNTKTDKDCVMQDLLKILMSLKNKHHLAPMKKIENKSLPPVLIPEEYGKILVKQLFGSEKMGTPAIRIKNGLYHITFDTLEIFNRMWYEMKVEEMPFFFFDPRDKKTVKVVIKGIPSHVPVAKPYANLAYYFSIKSVHRMTRGKDRIPLPILLVNAYRSPQFYDMFEITSLLGYEVSVEPFRKREFPTQCFQCQGFFHGARWCQSPPRCVICSGDHLSKNCDKSKSDKECIKCANCEGPHTANYKNCPVFLKHKIYYKFISMNRVPTRIESCKNYYEP